jgi:hypothetical protein
MVCKDHNSYCLNTVWNGFKDCAAVGSNMCSEWFHSVCYHLAENKTKPSSLNMSLVTSKLLIPVAFIWGISILFHNLRTMFPIVLLVFVSSPWGQHCKMKHNAKSKCWSHHILVFPVSPCITNVINNSWLCPVLFLSYYPFPIPVWPRYLLQM